MILQKIEKKNVIVRLIDLQFSNGSFIIVRYFYHNYASDKDTLLH